MHPNRYSQLNLSPASPSLLINAKVERFQKQNKSMLSFGGAWYRLLDIQAVYYLSQSKGQRTTYISPVSIISFIYSGKKPWHKRYEAIRQWHGHERGKNVLPRYPLYWSPTPRQCIISKNLLSTQGRQMITADNNRDRTCRNRTR